MKNAPALYEQELKQVVHSLLRFVLERLAIRAWCINRQRHS